MNEKPIIFDANEVQAVLAGNKTQHRTPLPSQPYVNEHGYNVLSIDGVRISDQCAAHNPFDDAIKRTLPATNAAPYRVGERLWVQEFHARTDRDMWLDTPHYYADGPLTLDTRHDAGLLIKYAAKDMPRWASRINLEVTNVRVERVQDITPRDSFKESCNGLMAFAADYWMVKHGAAAWFTDPWVWVIDFEVVTGK